MCNERVIKCAECQHTIYSKVYACKQRPNCIVEKWVRYRLKCGHCWFQIKVIKCACNCCDHNHHGILEWMYQREDVMFQFIQPLFTTIIISSYVTLSLLFILIKYIVMIEVYKVVCACVTWTRNFEINGKAQTSVPRKTFGTSTTSD